jgi:hypothetical protein
MQTSLPQPRPVTAGPKVHWFGYSGQLLDREGKRLDV